MILVTGGTGLVGAHLLLHLLQKDVPVKAIHRKKSNLKEVEEVFGYYTDKSQELFQKISWIEADLNDLPALEIAFENVTQVYHCAALISFDPNDYELLRTVNIEGTKNIVNLCIANGVKKLCHISSIGAIGRTVGNQEATEETEWNSQQSNVYALTKMDAELEVWRGAQEGLPVVIINPGVILGPGFWNTGTGILFKTAFKARKYYPPGGTGFVTVSDVVKIMTQLMESSITNEKFIVVADQLSYKEILYKVTQAFGKPSPNRELKFWELEILWRLDWLRNIFWNSGRKLTQISVSSLRKNQKFDNSKIQKQLGYSFEELDGTIEMSCQKFIERNP
ncbi:NAD-dependent epimerase/dehydratase family protein [Arenibacter sp. BSSL-BM3]|uniref:NAD-dependent epimerase/dehydratase family protein n=1 Tax=Arenibacter arenosicollis TaxID=2762274 RepID=A0ABR7QGW5_9FLAO|nr:NAD-dependent epimerase/dehydratase family protein [Arenibacter arenosicollis]MBC8766433.1 NAD-dependent epimerase/dehydratase family protein [Arenibacter arenosicollis]